MAAAFIAAVAIVVSSIQSSDTNGLSEEALDIQRSQAAVEKQQADLQGRAERDQADRYHRRNAVRVALAIHQEHPGDVFVNASTLVEIRNRSAMPISTVQLLLDVKPAISAEAVSASGALFGSSQPLPECTSITYQLDAPADLSSIDRTLRGHQLAAQQPLLYFYLDARMWLLDAPNSVLSEPEAASKNVPFPGERYLQPAFTRKLIPTAVTLLPDCGEAP